VSDDGKPIATAKLAVKSWICNSLDLPVIEHSEDVSLAAGAVMREGVTSTGSVCAECRRRGVRLRRTRRTTCRTYRRTASRRPSSAKGSLDQLRWPNRAAFGYV